MRRFTAGVRWLLLLALMSLCSTLLPVHMVAATSP